VEQGTFGVGAAARAYTLVVPAAVVAGAAPAGLLVFLHGCTQDAADARRGTGLDAAAERARLLVLYPEQPASANPQRCWNWFDPAHQGRDGGEPATLAAMAASVAGAHGVDPARVHVAGMSAGGAMALVLAANYPERFASVASHSGVPVGVARTSVDAWQVMRAPRPADAAAVRTAMGTRARPVPLLVVHGSADAVVAPGNGEATAVQWATALAATESPAVAAAVSASADARAARERRWLAGGTPVVRLVTVEGLGHAWSGGSRAGTFTDPRGPSAAELVVAHVRAHAAGAGRP
jgi:poly(hydroxyalkanoate) depolymerase family esterase